MAHRRISWSGGEHHRATAYNLVAIPVAAGILVRWGLDLPMSVGAVAMSLSTIIVAANAQLLRRLKLQRAAI
jgi:Cu2+-exporting ATPase